MNPKIPNAQPAKIEDLEIIFGNIISVLLGFGAIAAFIMLLVGGLKFLTSGTNPQQAEAAKKTITYSLGGLFLVIMSFLIMQLIETLTGAPVTEFKITLP